MSNNNSSKIKQGQCCDGVCKYDGLSVTDLFPKGLDKKKLLRERGSLLLQDVPLYPGAHTHVPSSGEHDPPF